jgi:SIR2-like domain
VSIDAPSNHPDFNALANEVGGDLSSRQEGEAIDRYLGRLSAAGVTVHEQVHNILSTPSSQPNLTHQALINIFKRPQDVRIVTTNFDRHFTTAALDRFGTAMPEVFCAPALPIGNEFAGIVYLHGSVEKPANRLVLTDSDFGRAYITEGWATRFLERLFSNFTVLFVGYSHQDMLLSYLARGLTAGTSGPGRFVLTPPNDDARWNNLGITPIHYPLSGSPELLHSQLQAALTAWATQSQAGALAVEERIRSIVTGGSPLTPDDDDFLKEALSDLATLRFFTRYTRGVEWLRWAEPQSLFQRLFAVCSSYSEQDLELASWFANQFAIQHTEEALDVLRRAGGALPLLLWREIALVLFRQKIHGEALSKWVSLLLTTAPPDARAEVLEYIFSHCTYPDDESALLLLFEYLTRPRVRLKESLTWTTDTEKPSKKTDIELDCAGSDHWLRLTWNAVFSGNLDPLAKRLSSMVSFHLTTAHRLLASFCKVSEVWDPLSQFAWHGRV